VEGKNLAKAAEVLKNGYPHIILLQEIRDSLSCLALIDSIGRLDYRLAVCSVFRDRSGIPTFQQLAIISRLPFKQAFWKSWSTVSGIDPPRGFAFSLLEFEGSHILAYSLHLKSNLVTGKKDNIRLNVLKRELAVQQMIHHFQSDTALARLGYTAVIIGGDFNTNIDDPRFDIEKTFSILDRLNFQNCFANLVYPDRITWPAHNNLPDATFDYIFVKNMTFLSSPQILESGLSDHWPVFCVIGKKNQ